MNAPRKSITNEAALRPHENAFQRWSMNDAMEIQPQPMTPRGMSGGMAPVATERHDTMEAHMPSSFRVYSPAETRSAPMRRGSYHSIETIDAVSDNVGARTLLKWTGIGIVAGLFVLTGLILVLNLGDDGHRVGAGARASIGKIEGPAAAAPAPVTPAQVAAPAAAPDLEIDAPPPPVKKTPREVVKKTTATTTTTKKKS